MHYLKRTLAASPAHHPVGRIHQAIKVKPSGEEELSGYRNGRSN